VAGRKEPSPSVAAFADHEVITPTHRLEKAVAESLKDDFDPVARAEAALAQLSKDFVEWMQAECERLETARQQVMRQGFTEKAHAELFRAAHDIKGEATTFGYPAVVGAAESLCRLLEHTPERSPIPLTLVEQHVDAVRAIAREYSRTDLTFVAATLTQRLREVTEEFLRNENADRPAYLESIFAPTLAPSGRRAKGSGVLAGSSSRGAAKSRARSP
jgi:HPt (histidine-containing phosphotransfer) domain-containing protein